MPSVPRRTSPVVASCCITPLASCAGIANPRPMLPAMLPRGLKLAVLMPTSSPLQVDQRAAGIAGVDRGVGLDEVLETDAGHVAALRPPRRCPRSPSARRRTDCRPRPRSRRRAGSLLSASGSAVRFCAGIFISATSVSASEPTKSAVERAAVGQRHRHLVGALDHVVVGEHVAALRRRRSRPSPATRRCAPAACSGTCAGTPDRCRTGC